MAKLLEDGKEVCEISNLSINSDNVFFKCKYVFQTIGLISKTYQVIDNGKMYNIKIKDANLSVSDMTATVSGAIF